MDGFFIVLLHLLKPFRLIFVNYSYRSVDGKRVKRVEQKRFSWYMLTFHYQISLIKKIKNIYRQYSCPNVTGSLMSKHYSPSTELPYVVKWFGLIILKQGDVCQRLILITSRIQKFTWFENMPYLEKVQNSFPTSNLKLSGFRRNPIGNRVIPVFSGQKPCTRKNFGIIQSF